MARGRLDDKVDSDQKVVDNELSLSLAPLELRSGATLEPTTVNRNRLTVEDQIRATCLLQPPHREVRGNPSTHNRQTAIVNRQPSTVDPKLTVIKKHSRAPNLGP